MKRLMPALAFAAAMVACAAGRAQDVSGAQATEAPPSAVALTLARQIGPAGLAWLRGPADDADAVATDIAQRLLSTQLAWRGVGCEPRNPECRATADRMAREAAPAVLTARREARARLMAYIIDDQMTPDAIAAASAAAKTPGGQRIVKLFATLADPSKISPAVGLRFQQSMAPSTVERTLGDRFFDATKHLPRATSLAPPPPIAPTRPRNPQ